MIKMQPKKRSKLRIVMGQKYYRLKRYLEWYFGNKKYARELLTIKLPYVIFTHRTPLIRKLKDVDMWMQYNKVTNLKIATKKLNGILLYPGETFSYWRLIGKPTKKKGYVEGMNLFYGKIRPSVGGGLCQLSNLIYWMTLHTPLTVTERYRHSYDIFPDVNRTQPFGSGATCVYNYLDLQVYNNTDDIYQLIVYLTDDHLVGEWRAETPNPSKYKVYEKKHWITQEYWGGYMRHNIIYRREYDLNGEIINDDYITENHAIMMYNPLIEGKPKSVEED
ncbi:VanW family protein [Thermohalobacter berrensis]|uniref:Vancomycin resistance protein n=1 Tax=Thermohalobacter berrensis TaxID=99594 RepID=A0A419T2Y1_9FIRM|nr:VanW family protein [Thermohalobacter berrensis]RKD31815.1 vancomycin resistance protein [Thermohalobacter berrensis]